MKTILALTFIGLIGCAGNTMIYSVYQVSIDDMITFSNSESTIKDYNLEPYDTINVNLSSEFENQSYSINGYGEYIDLESFLSISDELKPPGPNCTIETLLKYDGYSEDMYYGDLGAQISADPDDLNMYDIKNSNFVSFSESIIEFTLKVEDIYEVATYCIRN